MANLALMDDRAEALRRRVATYRRRLAEGVPSDLARSFLADIAKLEAELAAIREREARLAAPQSHALLRREVPLMSEKHMSAIYREKAAELRAAAERTSNFTVSVELENAADNYDRLAKFVEQQQEPLPRR